MRHAGVLNTKVRYGAARTRRCRQSHHRQDPERSRGPDRGVATVGANGVVEKPGAVSQLIGLAADSTRSSTSPSWLRIVMVGQVYGLSWHGETPHWDLLERVDLVVATGRRVSTYSGGMRAAWDWAGACSGGLGPPGICARWRRTFGATLVVLVLPVAPVGYAAHSGAARAEARTMLWSRWRSPTSLALRAGQGSGRDPSHRLRHRASGERTCACHPPARASRCAALRRVAGRDTSRRCRAQSGPRGTRFG